METKEQNRLNLFDIVKTTRISKNITQTELATKLEISKQYICDIENNRKPITIELAKEFAKVLEQSERDLVGMTLQELLMKNNLNYCVIVI
ncbi:helix-turn-helix domain-containing protein [Francisella tularensis]|uniref:helix-turn-helix domain-containing protein n=1 Tax=Francisella tularensis TaxID=263 RepID=UPI0001855348|nr:helix-turn-helix transcriptional regulator [Francisella tularensis]APC95442.1 helix-turn-helix family protein [Francisella tularensis subsp. novicida]EDZ89893.1 helix-turn-helix domain protein [Francisella tularensis subsp. novicida FTG]MBK2335044.1 helix-turn-helix transcriptional regulator [Francisella tularensis subsp. novicida]MBK2345413.1 helix-turn-helix transcriptional regulator [Francisella tularensis subsp. novicida]